MLDKMVTFGLSGEDLYTSNVQFTLTLLLQSYKQFAQAR